MRWDWSRTHLADGRSAVLYDVERREGVRLAVAHWFDDEGNAGTYDAPPIARLPATAWRLDRRTRSNADIAPQVTQSFEDGPFYSRSVIAAQRSGKPVASVHEHLSLERFGRRWLCGRNHALCVSTGSRPNAAPRYEDRRSWKSCGVSRRDVTKVSSRPGSSVSCSHRWIASRYGSAARSQSVPLSRCGTGAST